MAAHTAGLLAEVLDGPARVTLRRPPPLARRLRVFIWAALDCPGAFASGFPEIEMVLGRLAAEIRRPASRAQPLVVFRWPEGAEGRKHLAITALFTTDGELLAAARATWIALEAAELNALLRSAE